MKFNLEKISFIQDDRFSLIQRGILITILLLKDDDSKLTLAKFKAKVKINEIKDELIYLHKVGAIVWSGYNLAVKSIESKIINPKVIEVIGFMNNLYGTNFKSESKSTNTGIVNRLQDYTVDECKLVVANRYKIWKDDLVMNVHLNPMTIFRPSKFEKYLQESNRTKQGESLLNAVKNDLNDGDEITFNISKTLSDTDTYNLIIFTLDSYGKSIGNGEKSVKYGKDIKKTLNINENNLKRGGKVEFKYIYKLK
jgi:uncharacterized phage protein (TIGR02220 family)